MSERKSKRAGARRSKCKRAPARKPAEFLVPIPVRLAPDVLAQVDARASAAGMKRSEWLRFAIARALAGRLTA